MRAFLGNYIRVYTTPVEHKILWYNGLRISGCANFRTLKCVSA